MTAPASLEDFPHIVQAHNDASIHIAVRKDSGVVMRTVALSLAALAAPVIAGAIVGMVTRDGIPNEPLQVREAPFALASTAAPAARTIR